MGQPNPTEPDDPHRTRGDVDQSGPPKDPLDDKTLPDDDQILARRYDRFRPMLPTFPGYEVRGELGRGGMGIVYLARRKILNRQCALKVILAGAQADTVAVGRFLAEAAAVARLTHPNIVHIHHVGEVNGLPFIELEYVEGGSLEKLLDRKPWPPQKAAALVAALAEGIAEAHRAGIIHRDLKPANILLAADGSPRITDFGVAKSLDSGSALTATESILGSPIYMSPEQAQGKTREVGPEADIYSLGSILYELLTGLPPFRGATVFETLEQVRTAEPAPPSRLVPGLPRDVETIALRCLQKEPTRRYRSADSLADDLRRFLDGRPIQARPVGPAERGWRWCRRNPAMAAMAAAVLALIASIAVGATWAAVHFRGQVERIRWSEESRRRALAESVVSALPVAVPLIVNDLRPASREALPILREMLADSAADPARRLRAAIVLTLLGDDCSAFLIDQIPTAPALESQNLMAALETAGRSCLGPLGERFRTASGVEERARFAVSMLGLGDLSAARSMLAITDDPSDRVAFIHHFPQWHGNLTRLVSPLREVNDPAFRGGLLAAIGRIPSAQLQDDERATLASLLRELDRDDPNGATHSAAHWALKQWGIEPSSVTRSRRPVPGRRWFVNDLGMTMIEPPIGALESEMAAILPFSMSACEVTVEQFRQFLNDRDVPQADRPEGLSLPSDREGDLPIWGVSSPDAFLFCNWLSRREGRTPCYSRGQRPDDWRCQFGADGYRLPTRYEFEYAARAGSTTLFPVGPEPESIGDYANVAGVRFERGASRCPNPWGFFDLVGNVWDFAWDVERRGRVAPMHPMGESSRLAQPVIMGGSADGGPTYVRVGIGFHTELNTRGHGFHVVCGEGDLASRRARVEKQADFGDNAGLLAARGRARSDAGDHIGAIDDFRRWVQLRPRSPHAWGWLAASFSEEGRHAEAVEAIEHSIALDPSIVQNYRVQAKNLSGLGRWDEAREAYRELVRRGDARGEEFTGLGLAMARAKRPLDRAAIAAELKLPAASTLDRARAHEAVARGIVGVPGAAAGLMPWAVDLARGALSSLPEAEAGSAHQTLGLALYRTGDNAAAARELEAAARLLGDSHFGLIAFPMAIAQWRLGHREKALMIFDRGSTWMNAAPDRDPEVFSLRNEAATVLDTRLPRPDFRTVLGDFDPIFSFEAGQYLASRGQRTQALAAYRRSTAFGRGPFVAAHIEHQYTHAYQMQAELMLSLFDRPGYEALRTDLLDREAANPKEFPTSVDAERIAKIACMVPIDESRDVEHVLRLARDGAGRDGYQNNDRTTLGLASFRAGRYEESLRWLREARRFGRPPSELLINELVATMALHAMGRRIEARIRLTVVLRTIAAEHPTGPRFRPFEWSDYFNEILAREAESVILLDPVFPDSPFAVQSHLSDSRKRKNGSR